MRWRASGAALVVLARPTNGNKGLARWSSSGTGGTDFLTEIPSNIFRFGSGCYNYICAAGLLHIMVRDISYSCGFQGQKIPIQLKVKSFSISSCILCQMSFSWPTTLPFRWIRGSTVGQLSALPAAPSVPIAPWRESPQRLNLIFLFPMIPDIDVNWSMDGLQRGYQTDQTWSWNWSIANKLKMQTV